MEIENRVEVEPMGQRYKEVDLNDADDTEAKEDGSVSEDVVGVDIEENGQQFDDQEISEIHGQEEEEENGQRLDDGTEEVEEEDDSASGGKNRDEEENGEDLEEMELEIPEVENIEVDEDEGERVNERLVRLPLSKIKKIMKTDEETGLINRDALFATTILAEHFISMVAQQSYKLAAASKKKTVTLNHVKSAITSSSMFDFLEGTLPQLES